MRPWELLDTRTVPGEGADLRLYRRGDEFSIKIGQHTELMNSRVHGSEDALAQLGCQRIADRTSPKVLIGGLGMGYTLAAALAELGPDAQVTVAELVPAVVEWNRSLLGHLAAQPLQDARVSVHQGDVGALIREQREEFDAILLDVDNGPEGLSRKGNDAIYSPAGLQAAKKALRPGGVLGVWSISPDEPFSRRLRKAGFQVDEVRVKARLKRGGRHMIWFGAKP